MTKFLLSLHVLAAIIAVGPITVAASMFPPSARKALAEPEDERAVSALRLLHRICRVYGGVGVAVPVFGFATAMSMGVLKDAWLIVSMLLTALAAMVLLALVLPRQEEILEDVARGDGAGAGSSRRDRDGRRRRGRHRPTRHVHRRVQPALGDGHGPDDRAARIDHGRLTSQRRSRGCMIRPCIHSSRPPRPT